MKINSKTKVFIIWLLAVIIWNFGFPSVPPIADVIVAVILSFASQWLNKFFKIIGQQDYDVPRPAETPK